MSDDVEPCLRIANIKEIKAHTALKKGTGVKSLIWNLGQ